MRRFSPATAISLVALFFSFGGASLAATHYLITSTTQIKPAVLKTLRGARGSQGTRGIPGPQGPIGVTGAAGATVPPEYTDALSGNTVSVDAGATIGQTVYCPGVTQAEGGGYDANGMIVTASMPSGVNGWTVTVTNQTGGTLQLTPWVTCRGTAAALAVRTSTP